LGVKEIEVENSRDPLHGPLRGPSRGRMKKRYAPAILFIGMAGVVPMEVIDTARLP
jgi:hypothetical protein